MGCEALIKAIDAYIAKADDDLADELDAEGRALPDDSVKMASDMEDGIAAALVSQTEYFIREIKKRSSVKELLDVFDEIKAKDAYCDEIAEVAFEQFTKYIPKMVVSYVDKVDSGIKITAISKRTTAWIESWSKDLADIMKLNSHNEIEAILKKGLENGDGVVDVTKAILDSGIRDEYYKAHRVAVTEMLRAHNVSKNEARMQCPCITKKKWRHTGGYKNQPRENHVAIDGQTVDKDKPFELVGADGETYNPMFPVDTILPASEAINCHCIAEDVVDESILGLSVEERQRLRDEALAEMDEEWENELDAQYEAAQAAESEE